MEILGLTGIQAAVFITVVGLALTNLVGWLKNPEAFKPRLVAASAILAAIVTLPIVSLTIGKLPDDMTELEQFAFIATYLGQVAGFDALAKGFNKIRVKARTPQNSGD